LVLSKAEKDTGGNHFQYSDVHVLQYNDQKLAPEYRDGVGPSSKRGRGGAGSVNPPLLLKMALLIGYTLLAYIASGVARNCQ